VSYPVASLDFPPNWQGLYARDQLLPDESPEQYALVADNVEFYGSVMKKRQGSFLLNGLCDTLQNQMDSGDTILPGLELFDWSYLSDTLIAGQLVKIQVIEPGDPNRYTVVTFTISSVNAFGDITVTPAAPYNLPAGSLVLYLPWTSGKRIGGLFQAKFRNGAFPMLVNAVDNTTGVLSLHVQANRQCRPLSLTARIPQTTVSVTFGTGVSANIGKFTSVEGLAIGDWVNFPAGPAGQQNARVSYVNPADNTVVLDPTTPVFPVPTAGMVVRFLPTTCPGRITPSRPIGLGKLSASHMGNRTLLAQPQFSPLRYAHTDSAVLDVMVSTGAPYDTFRTISALPAALVGRQVVLSDIAPDSAGQTHLRTISAITGLQVTVTPALPWALSPGCLVDVCAVSRVGIRAPVSIPTLAQGTGGFMTTGSFSVRITYASTEGGVWVESEACKETARITLVAPNNALVISNIPVPLDPRVTEKRIYRTAAGGDGVWYFIKSIAPSLTTYTEIQTEAGLGIQLEEFVNYPPPETMEVVVEWPHAQRLMGIAQVGQDAWAVVWSDSYDVNRAQVKPECWPIDNFLFVGLDSGDKPRGIAAFYDSMLVFCERSIWRIQGTPPDLVIEPVNFQQHDQSGIGLESHQSIVVDQNEVIFPGPDGVYLIDRFQGVATGFQSQRISRQIDNLWDETYATRRIRAHGCFVRSRRQYRLFWPLQSITQTEEPDTVFTYQFDADVNGAPHFWALWHLTQDIFGNHRLPSCSTVAQPEAGDGYLFASVKEVNFIGTADGAVLGLDYMFDNVNNGFVDFSLLPYRFEYRTLWFNPAGEFGLTALGRYLHVALQTYQPGQHQPNPPAPAITTLRLELRSSYMERPALGSVPPNVAFDLAPIVVGPTGGLPYLYRLVLLCRGQYHQIAFVDDRQDRMVELHRMAYFFQRLPETVIAEDYVQVEPLD